MKIKEKVLKGFKDDKWVLSGSDKSLISLGVDLTLAEVGKAIDERIFLHEQHINVEPIPLIIRELKELKQKLRIEVLK